MEGKKISKQKLELMNPEKSWVVFLLKPLSIYMSLGGSYHNADFNSEDLGPVVLYFHNSFHFHKLPGDGGYF